MRASRAGALAAEALASDRRGRIVSVHARAVNVLLDDGPLVTLLPRGTPLHPWAIAVPLDPAAFEWLREGEPVSVVADVLEAGPLRIEVENVPVVELRIARRSEALTPERVAALARLVPGTNDDPFREPIEAALEKFRGGGHASELVEIVGVGSGLTPSGDDVLVGVLAGLDAAHWVVRAIPGIREQIVVALGSSVSRTSRLSAQMLAAAASRLYAEPVLAVLDTLAESDPPPAVIEEAVASLLAVGHRSGADTLRGIVAALERATRA